MSIPRLTEDEIARVVGALPDWSLHDGSLVREFRFKDFSAAWGFMSRVALLAERHDHHPDWSNAYSRVRIALSTHDSGGLTAKDTALAQAIDAVA